MKKQRAENQRDQDSLQEYDDRFVDRRFDGYLGFFQFKADGGRPGIGIFRWLGSTCLRSLIRI